MTSVRHTDDRNEPSKKTVQATHFVLGGRQFGVSVARRLHAEGHAVAVVGGSHDSQELPGVPGDPTNVDDLEASGLDGAELAVASTRSDARNFLIARLVRTQFDVSRVLLLVHDPARFEPLATGEHEPVCVTSATAAAVVDQI